MEPLKFINIFDPAVEEEKRKLEKLVRIDGDFIILDKYDIALERIQTPAELIHWICQLSGKEWITKEILRRFICLVCEYHNFNIPGGYY